MAEPVSFLIITTGLAGATVLVAGLGVTVALATFVHTVRKDRRKRRVQHEQVKESYLAVRKILILFS
jgi:heme/copper-type cytochrome/quinol oxidase subunit 2